MGLGNDATIKIGATTAGGTATAFSTIAKGFRAVADGLRAQASALRQVGSTKASKELRRVSTEIAGLAREMTKESKAVDASVAADKRKQRSLDQTRANLDATRKSVDNLAKAEEQEALASKSSVSYNKNLVTKEHEYKLVYEAAKKYQDQLRQFKSFEDQEGKPKNRADKVKIFADYENKLKRMTAAISAWRDRLNNLGLDGNRWASILGIKQFERAEKLNGGVLRLTANGFDTLEPRILRALGMNEKQVQGMVRSAQETKRFSDAIDTLKAKQSGLNDVNRKTVTAFQVLGRRLGTGATAFAAYEPLVRKTASAYEQLSIKSMAMGKKTEIAVSRLKLSKVAMAAVRGEIEVTNKGIKVLTTEGFRALGKMSLDTAKELGVLGPAFNKLLTVEKQFVQESGLTAAAVRKTTEAHIAEGKSVNQLTAQYTSYVAQMRDGAKLTDVMARAADKAAKAAQRQAEAYKKANLGMHNSASTVKKEADALLVVIAKGGKEGINAAKKYEALSRQWKAGAIAAADQLRAVNALIKKYPQFASAIQRRAKAGADLLKVEQALQKVTANRAAAKKAAIDAEKVAEKVEILRHRYDALLKSKTRFAAQAQRVISSFAKTGNRAKAAEAAVRKLNRRFEESQKRAGSAATAFDKLSKSFATYLRYTVVSRIIMSITQALRDAIVIVAQYDQSLKDIEAITQATSAEMEQMAVVIEKTAAITKFSVTEIANGLKVLGQAGFTAEESMAAIQGISDLATGTLTDMASAVDLVSSTIRVFELDASEATHVADVFASAVNGSKLTIDKIRTALNYVGPVAKLAGVSFKDLTATMMMLANKGIRASTLATGLRQVFSKLLKPTKEFEEAVNAAGLTMADLNPKFNSMGTVVKNLGLVVKDAQDAFKYFGIRGSAAIAALVDAGPEELKKMQQLIERTGIASDMAATQLEGLALQWKQLGDKLGVTTVKLAKLLGLDTAASRFIQGLRTSADVVLDFVDKLAVLKKSMFDYLKDQSKLLGTTAEFVWNNAKGVTPDQQISSLVRAIMGKLLPAKEKSIDKLKEEARATRKLVTEQAKYTIGLESEVEAVSNFKGDADKHKAYLEALILKYPELAKEIRDTGGDLKELGSLFDKLALKARQKEFDLGITELDDSVKLMRKIKKEQLEFENSYEGKFQKKYDSNLYRQRVEALNAQYKVEQNRTASTIRRLKNLKDVRKDELDARVKGTKEVSKAMETVVGWEKKALEVEEKRKRGRAARATTDPKTLLADYKRVKETLESELKQTLVDLTLEGTKSVEAHVTAEEKKLAVTADIYKQMYDKAAETYDAIREKESSGDDLEKAYKAKENAWQKYLTSKLQALQKYDAKVIAANEKINSLDTKRSEEMQSHVDKIAAITDAANTRRVDAYKKLQNKLKSLDEKRVKDINSIDAGLVTDVLSIEDKIRKARTSGKSSRKQDTLNRKAALARLSKAEDQISKARQDGDKAALNSGKQLIKQAASILGSLNNQKRAISGLKMAKDALVSAARVEKELVVKTADKAKQKARDEYNYSITKIESKFTKAVSLENSRHDLALKHIRVEADKWHEILSVAERLRDIASQVAANLNRSTPVPPGGSDPIAGKLFQPKEDLVEIADKSAEAKDNIAGLVAELATLTNTGEAVIRQAIVAPLRDAGAAAEDIAVKLDDAIGEALLNGGQPIELPVDDKALTKDVKDSLKSAKEAAADAEPIPINIDADKLKDDIEAVKETTEDSFDVSLNLDTEEAKEKTAELSTSIASTIEDNPAKVIVKPDETSFGRVKRRLRELAKDLVVNVKAKVSTVHHMAQGGRLPGVSSKHDTVPVMGRPGEWFIRNEAVSIWEKVFGSNFMKAVNSPNSSLGQNLKDAVLSGMQFVKMSGGGQLARMATPAKLTTETGNRDMGVINFTIGNQTIPIREEVDVLRKLKFAVAQELRMRPN